MTIRHSMIFTNETPLLNVSLKISDLLMFDVSPNFKEDYLSIDEKLFFVKAVRALAQDILSISDDFETELSFYIQESGVLLEMDRSYPFLALSSFKFELYEPFIGSKTMNHYINSIIVMTNRQQTKDSYLNIADFRPFFENIRYVDRILDMDGAIFSFYKDVNFLRGHESIIFPPFKSFNNFHSDTDYPILTIYFGELSVTISATEISFTVLDGATTVTFSNQSQRFNTKNTDDMGKIVIDMYNMETMSDIDTMKNLMVMIRMKAI